MPLIIETDNGRRVIPADNVDVPLHVDVWTAMLCAAHSEVDRALEEHRRLAAQGLLR